jgi:hypothetical protein
MPRALPHLLLVPALVVGGCSHAQIDPAAERFARAGDFGKAAAIVQRQVSQDASDRDYMLTRLRLLSMGVAEGQPAMVDEAANQLFALLRTQGVNEDKAVATVVLNEGQRVWKGEPFEQAMAYATIAMQKAMLGEWDNARAASNASLFLLRDFSQAMGKDGSPEELAQFARSKAKNDESAADAILNNGYVVGRTDFALGYLLNAASNTALARDPEASDNLLAAEAARSSLAPVAARMRSPFNTLLVVEAGEGPQKISFGEDNTLTRYEPRTRSDERELQFIVRDANGNVLDQGSVPFATDVNAMARSHRWNDLQTVRNIKSALGSAMVLGGLVVASEAKHGEAKLAGALVAGLGLLMKAGSGADTRYAELLPQRVYVLPLQLSMPGTQVELAIAGESASATTLWGLGAPSLRGGAPRPMQLRVVRMPSTTGQRWRTALPIFASELTDQAGLRIPGDDLPFIFGGRCLRTPTPDAMERYHNAGNLLGLTHIDLENIYRAEGIALRVEDQRGIFAPHVVDGLDDGRASLVPPLGGTIGALRVFGREPRTFVGKSEEWQRAFDQVRDQKTAPTSEPGNRASVASDRK